ncbi:MAG: hypothetical protein DWG83_01675 [Chloroflexi bacterium]|nr:hypothetical protein [Chloroflexota bacterium]
MQLQQVIDEFDRAGVALFAISYDSVPTLAEFAGTRGITYPLLSDHNSEVIRRFGILNSLIEPHEEIHGIPFPGCYVVDANGRVTAKFFYQVYRDRPAPLAVLRDHLGADVDLSGAPRGEASEGGVHVSAVLADRTLVPFQHTPLYLRITDTSGAAIGGAAVEGARIASVEVTGEGVEVGALYPVVAPDGAAETAVPIRFVSLETARATLDVTVLVEVPDAPEATTLRLSLDVPVTPLMRRDAD